MIKIINHKKEEITLEHGMYGIITFYAKKYKEYVTRTFAFGDKCYVGEDHIVYMDSKRENYRRANATEERPVSILVAGKSN